MGLNQADVGDFPTHLKGSVHSHKKWTINSVFLLVSVHTYNT